MLGKTIWKWVVPTEDEFCLELPEGAEFLHFGTQREELTLWVLVDPGRLPRECYFRLAGTGHPLPAETSASRYIGTTSQQDGQLVWHLFLNGWGSMSG
jgi:hypothetical protein